MRRFGGKQLLALISSFVAVTIALPLGAVAQSTEIPGVQVTADLPGTIHQAATFAVTFGLTNTGAAQLSDVTVAPMNACDPSSTGALVEFDEVAGNGDAVFDPGEVWSYLASRCVDGADDLVGVDLSVFDGVETLTASYSFPYTPVSPIQADPLGNVSADQCLVDRFAVPLHVVTNTPVSVTGAFLELAIPLEGGGLESVSRVEFTELLHVSANGDAIFDPGEEWLATFFFGTFAQCADAPDPPLVLFLSMEGTSVDSGAPWCFGTENCSDPAVEVGTITEVMTAVQATTTTTSPTLPFTGTSAASFVQIALAILAIGALLLATARSSRSEKGNDSDRA